MVVILSQTRSVASKRSVSEAFAHRRQFDGKHLFERRDAGITGNTRVPPIQQSPNPLVCEPEAAGPATCAGPRAGQSKLTDIHAAQSAHVLPRKTRRGQYY
jgi:hypothetical protein